MENVVKQWRHNPGGFSGVMLAVAAAWLLYCGFVQAQSPELPPDVLRALVKAGVPAQSASIVVQALPRAGSDSAAHAVLRHRADLPMNPASVMKLVTTYAALDQLGGDFTWKNRAYIDGTVHAGILHGNLILRGSGDPKLVLERIDEWFKAIQARGIQQVRGDIVLDRSAFELPSKQAADFDDEPLRPYNTLPDGFLLNFKSLIFTFTPDPATGRVVLRAEPPIARVEIPAEVAAAAGSCGDWRAALRADFSSPGRVLFAGRYPLSCGERVWPVAYVAAQQYAARVVEAMWRAAGGQLSGSVREGLVPASAQLWHTAESLPLSDIIADINKFSNNVMAQQVFLTLSAASPAQPVNQPASFAQSRAAIALWWHKRFPGSAAPVLENGSGLSRMERASAASLNTLLQAAAQHSRAEVFAKSLGIAGVDGTVARMRDRLGASPTIGRALLKTGTLKDVSAIAGYADAQDGQRYSLVAIINHPNAAAARPALDALLEWVIKRH